MKTEEEYKKEIMELIKEADSIGKRSHISDYVLVERSEEDVEKVYNIIDKNLKLISEALDNKLHDKFLFFDGNWENGSPNFFLEWTTDKILIALPTIYSSLNNSLNICSYYAVIYNDNHKNTSSIIFNNELYKRRLCIYNNIIDFIKKEINRRIL